MFAKKFYFEEKNSFRLCSLKCGSKRCNFNSKKLASKKLLCNEHIQITRVEIVIKSVNRAKQYVVNNFKNIYLSESKNIVSI